jgi:hypothetical protein
VSTSKRKCLTPRCRNDPKDRRYCSTCRSRKSRAADPVKASYLAIKNRAKQRGKPFELTLDYFREFCYKYDYIKGKGKTKESFSIDCIINDLGYVEGNIRVLPLGDNSRKGAKILSYDYLTGYATVMNIVRNNADNWDELSPEKLRKNSEKQYGLDYEEALEMSYDNIQNRAKFALKGIKPIPDHQTNQS